MKLICDEATGSFTLDFEERGLMAGYCGAYRNENGELVKTTGYGRHVLSREKTEDVLGSGERLIFRHYDSGKETLVQEFVLYDEGYITCGLWLERPKGCSINYLAPLYYEGESAPVQMEGAVRFLAAPFDNDKWAKFVDYPIEYAAMGYEFTVVHREGSKEGLVIGSLDHDNWKTGITIGAGHFQAFSGAATEDTRDLHGIAHGSISGTKVKAARIFLGSFPDYQEGFQVYGKCNAAIRPALPWEGGVIFGWNSWAALMGDLTLERYQEASDFMTTLKDTYCGGDGRQYINFDAFWNSFSHKMQNAVDYVEKNGQTPGSYFCPFITGKNFQQEVSGTGGDYIYEDILLRDRNGNILPPVDGLYSLDPTHPGTLQHMEYELGNIIRWGFQFVKTDFVGHGCREGAFYNQEITTGVQAYCYGMEHFLDCLKKAPRPVFVSLSIAPIFPHGYGHARRISCDAFGSLDQSAYLNNCITYLWWMNHCLYRFNDPDHIVIYKTYDKHSTTLEEGRTRYHTGVICGSLMITSDDYRMPEARERALEVLGNEKLNRIARKGESFRPVAGAEGEYAADIFIRKDEEGTVVALFNYSLSQVKTVRADVETLGFTAQEVTWEDLWSGEQGSSKDGVLEVKLIPAQSRMLLVRG